MGHDGDGAEPDPARLAGKITGAVETLGPDLRCPGKLGCTVVSTITWVVRGTTNQVVVIDRPRAAATPMSARCTISITPTPTSTTSAAQLALLKPHLLAVNLNGMVWRGTSPDERSSRSEQGTRNCE